MYYREWTRQCNIRTGLMVSEEDLVFLSRTNDPGYSSVYLFKEQDALLVKSRRSSKNLGRFEVSSDKLIIDIDEGDAALDEAEKVLKCLNYGYDVWASGGKGYHIILSHDFITSTHLPYSHRRFLENLNIKCDLALYQHGRLVSLPGRIHPKTAVRKHFVKSVKGCKISFPIVEKPDVKFLFDDEGCLDSLGSGLFYLSNMVVKEPYVGNRHTTIWGTSKDMMEAGVSFNTTLELMLKVNESWKNSKEPEEVEKAVEQAYQ